jgi:hypothetical protein
MFLTTHLVGFGAGSTADPNTLLLLHGDGADAATTTTDSSLSARAVTFSGNAQLDTAQSKFGGSSFLFDGTGDSISVPDSADWVFGDFTIEYFLRYNSVTVGGHVGQHTSANEYWVIYRTGTPTLRLNAVTGGASVIDVTGSWTPSTATWYHVAVTRSGNDFRLFVDGTQVGVTTTDASPFPNIAAALQFGNHTETGGLNGWLDEIRVSNTARYTANFTAPTAPFEG